MQSAQLLPSAAEQEPEELVRFREKWKAEVHQKRTLTQAPASLSIANASSSTSDTVIQPTTSRQTISGAPVLIQSSSTHHPASSPSLGSAVEVYRTAVRHEQHSELDDALRLYRQAFRMDSNVDRAYHREETLNAILSDAAPPTATPDSSHKRTSSTGSDRISHDLASLIIKSKVTVATVATGTLASLLAGFPKELVFEQEDEQEGAPLKSLPEEILVLILRYLDPMSLERFASVSRKARVVSLDSAIWRELVEMTYKPPQVLDIDTVAAVINAYMSDFRRVFVEYPRVRLDGVYIAVCHYVRPGVSENAWANISHLITYHRYLIMIVFNSSRFFPNGHVLSLLTNEEFSPQQLVPLLKPTLRMQGLFMGTWHLTGTTVEILNLIDSSGKPATETASSHHTSSSSRIRYRFQMTLTLRSRPLGRWNRLDLAAYDSVEIDSGEAVPVALKHERPFWFSKVRSY